MLGGQPTPNHPNPPGTQGQGSSAPCFRFMLAWNLRNLHNEPQGFIDGFIGRKCLRNIRGKQNHILSYPPMRRVSAFGYDSHLGQIVFVTQFVIVRIIRLLHKYEISLLLLSSLLQTVR